MADPFTGWAIVELMGRRRIAGLVTADAPLLQATRLQVDIYPGDVTAPAATMFTSYPVYCLTPCDEALARKVGADSIRHDMPVARWQLSALADPWAAPAIGPGDPDYADAEIVGDDEPDYADAEIAVGDDEDCDPPDDSDG